MIKITDYTTKVLVQVDDSDMPPETIPDYKEVSIPKSSISHVERSICDTLCLIYFINGSHSELYYQIMDSSLNINSNDDLFYFLDNLL